VGPAEVGQGSIGQRKAPSLGMGEPDRGSRGSRSFSEGASAQDRSKPEEIKETHFHDILLSLDDVTRGGYAPSTTESTGLT
ncbi:MAG: hypothetical protein WD380_08900, partial [Gaiellaceae bacterium]